MPSTQVTNQTIMREYRSGSVPHQSWVIDPRFSSTWFFTRLLKEQFKIFNELIAPLHGLLLMPENQPLQLYFLSQN